MKKTLIFLAFLFASALTSAQAPHGFNYQGVARDSDGNPLTEVIIDIEFIIHKDSPVGDTVYHELWEDIITDKNGLFNIKIGTSTNVIQGSIGKINWGNGSFYLEVFLDGQSVGTSQLLSVPYALHSNSSGNRVSILDYGANPDSGFQDDTHAIQSAIDENPGKTIVFPAGWFHVTNDIIVPHSVELVGEGKRNTTFQPVDCNGFVITGGGVTIKNMFIYGFGTSQKSGVFCIEVNNILLENLYFQNLTFPIVLDRTWNSRIDKVDVLINPAQTPQVAQGIRLVGQSVNNHISNCHIIANDFGISIIKDGDDAEGLMITNTLIAQCKSGIYSEGILSLHISNCIIDLIAEWAINVKNSRGMLFSNNWVATQENQVNPVDEAIHLEESIDCHISNNNLKCLSGTIGVRLINSSNNTITGNTIELSNSSGFDVYIEPNSDNNIVKNNLFKWVNNPNNSPIVNQGNGNIISDNININ